MKFYTIGFFFVWYLLGLWAPRVYGQHRNYFDHKIIIKYKSDAELATMRAKNGINPKQSVQRMLQQEGATQIQPVWHFNTKLQLQGRYPGGAQRDVQDIKRIYKVNYTSGMDAAVFAAKLSQLSGVEYAEPLYIRKMQFTPNDPISNSYQEVHRFKEAWDVTKGSSKVVIAIVDAGVNYLHPDLDDKLWVNTDEIPPAVRAQIDEDADGTVSSAEVLLYLQQNSGDYNFDGAITLADALATGSPLLSGSDTDGNGLADDIFGWDYWQSGGVNGAPVIEDNNPILDASDHGTHVAGIAAAEPDNGEGLAGTGFNVRYMAIKAGGIPDDPSTNDNESQEIGFGYEGILYAAMQGADVINCSWGGNGYSNFENDIINFATDMGSLVVAAAGNEANKNVDFPSGYDKAVSVGSIRRSEQVSAFSNTGYKLDVLATGSNIKSTSYDSTYVLKSGTSMSAPVVAGLAGLLKSLHPEWKAQRIAAQIRSSSVYLNASDAREGHGAVDAYRAVTTSLPGVRILSAHFTDSKGGKLNLGEGGHIQLKIINDGQTTGNLKLQLQVLEGEGITLSQPSKTVGALATGDSTRITFPVRIANSYDLSILPAFRLMMTDNSRDYDDFRVFTYDDILFDVMAANNIKTSFAGDGSVGFTDPFAGRGGVGFIPRKPSGSSFTEGANLLFEGGLMIEADGQMFDAVRSVNGTISKDFNPVEAFGIKKKSTVSDQDAQTIFTFQDAAGTTGGKVQLDTYAFNTPALSNVVYLKYTIINTSSTQNLSDVYVGLYNDWDLGANASNNSISYSAPDSILYISDEAAQSPQPLVAVAHLGPISSALALNNASQNSAAVPVALGDGFSDEEKMAALRAGTDQTDISGADVSAVIASGPYTLHPGARLAVGFVYAFGDDLSTLRSQIKEARKQAPFEVSKSGIILTKKIPDATNIFQNYPNPFSDKTTIRVDLKETSRVKIAVYDVLGRRVDVLRDEQMQAQTYYIPFVPKNLSSGVYFVRLQTGQKIKTIPITYIK